MAPPWIPCVPRGSIPRRRRRPGCVVVSTLPFKRTCLLRRKFRTWWTSYRARPWPSLDVVTTGGTLTVINVHGPGSGGHSWASKACFWADVAMYAAPKSAGGTRPVLIGGDFNVWLESPRHPTTKRFVPLWEQCGFLMARHSVEEDRQPTCEGHKVDSYLLNAPLVPWAMRECQYLALGRSPTALGSDHGAVVPGSPLAVAAKERITRLAYSHA